jgi:ketosteroid isomerase-like protein
MSTLKQLAVACLGLLAVCTVAAGDSMPDQLRQQVEETERAFARTMADRDHAAFVSYLSDETIFFAGDTPLRGKQTVADSWEPYYQGPDAPFSWEPEQVVVLDSGALALSSGPVRNPAGERIATFQSVWRLEADGQWRIVFDKGSRDCPDTAPEEGE